METPERYWSGLYWDGFVPESIGQHKLEIRALELLHAESEDPTIDRILNACRMRMVQQNEPIQEYHVSLIDMAADEEEKEAEEEIEKEESTESVTVKNEEKLLMQPTSMSMGLPLPPLLPIASISGLESATIVPPVSSGSSLSNSSISTPSTVATSNSSITSQVKNSSNSGMTDVIPSTSLSPSSVVSTHPTNHGRCSGRCLVLRLWHNDVFLGARETAKGDPGAKCKDWHFIKGEFAHELTLEETDQLLEHQALKTE